MAQYQPLRGELTLSLSQSYISILPRGNLQVIIFTLSITIFNWWCFLSCGVSFIFSYAVLQCYCFLLLFFFLSLKSVCTRYSIDSVNVSLYSDLKLYIRIQGICKHFLIQDLNSIPVSWLNVCRTYSHVLLLLFVSIVCLHQKFSSRVIISLIQIFSTLKDSIWRDYMSVKNSSTIERTLCEGILR